MNAPPEIVEGGIPDIDAVMTIMDAAFEAGFGEAWTRGQCLGILSLDDVWLSMASASGRPIGFALARRLVDDAELLLLAIVPEARRHGGGRTLIEHVAARARGRGADRLLLEVRATNPALALYAGAGFTPIGRRAAYYRGTDGSVHDALTLARRLDGAASAVAQT